MTYIDKIDDGEEEEGVKIQELQIRKNTLEGRARIAEDKVKEISSKKMAVQKKIEEIPGRRALVECNLRIEQCTLLEMRFSEIETGEEPSEILERAVEEEVKSLEGELDVIHGELRALKEEKKVLIRDLKDAKGSHFGIVQALKAVQAELDGLR